MDLEGLDDFFDQAVLEFFKNDQLICSNTTTATSEFRTVGEEEIRKLVENNSNKNTIKSTASWPSLCWRVQVELGHSHLFAFAFVYSKATLNY